MIDKIALDLLDRVAGGNASTLAEMFDNIDRAEMTSTIKVLEGLATDAVRVARYLDYRCMGACHENALARSNRAVLGVRTALGFALTPSLDY